MDQLSCEDLFVTIDTIYRRIIKQQQYKKALQRAGVWAKNVRRVLRHKPEPFKKLDLEEAWTGSLSLRNGSKSVKYITTVDEDGVVERYPVSRLKRVTPIPTMTTWIQTHRNLAVADKIAETAVDAKIHIPYFGENTFSVDEKFIDKLEKGYSHSIDGALVDEVFYELALELTKIGSPKAPQAAFEAKHLASGYSKAILGSPSSTRILQSAGSSIKEVQNVEMPSDNIFRVISCTFEKVGSPAELRSKFLKMSRNGSLRGSNFKLPVTTVNAFNIDGDGHDDHVKQPRNRTMDSFHRLFCRRCFVYSCLTHIEAGVENVFPEYQPKKGPFLAPRKIQCSTTCYLAPEYNLYRSKSETDENDNEPMETGDIQKAVEWTLSDTSMYLALSKVFPRNFCIIAEIMMKSCRLVSQHAEMVGTDCSDEEWQKLLIPIRNQERQPSTSSSSPPSITDTVQTRKRGFPNRRGQARRVSAKARYTPCFHPGSLCGPENEDCNCQNSNTYCEKFCNCTNCKNRFQACFCKTSCTSRLCPCFSAGRECDPDLCMSCGAGKCDDSASCRNIEIQRAKHKRLRLAKSTIPDAGWGIFAAENIEEGDFVYEYTGDLITYAEADRRALAYDKRCHTYLFELNDHFMVDAMVRGNKMRFANHSDAPNCTVKVLMVNGDHRIGVFANENIKIGQELFIYYKSGDYSTISYCLEFYDESKKDSNADKLKDHSAIVLTIHQEEQHKLGKTKNGMTSKVCKPCKSVDNRRAETLNAENSANSSDSSDDSSDSSDDSCSNYSEDRAVVSAPPTPKARPSAHMAFKTASYTTQYRSGDFDQ